MSEGTKEYQRGYAAGRRRAKITANVVRVENERKAFLDRAFLAALPACIAAQGWTQGEKPITGLDDRVALAWRFAQRALLTRRT